MRQVGDYEWRQLSQWEFAPDRCVEKYSTKPHGTFHYYLIRVAEVISSNQWKVETVESLDGVPAEVLGCADSTINVRAPKQ